MKVMPVLCQKQVHPMVPRKRLQEWKIQDRREKLIAIAGPLSALPQWVWLLPSSRQFALLKHNAFQSWAEQRQNDRRLPRSLRSSTSANTDRANW